jgi:hypothetical protein
LEERKIGKLKGHLLEELRRIEEIIEEKDTKIFLTSPLIKALELLTEENSPAIDESLAEIINEYCKKRPDRIIKFLELLSSIKGAPKFVTLSSQILSQEVNLPTALRGEKKILLPTNGRGSDLIRAINKISN